MPHGLRVQVPPRAPDMPKDKLPFKEFLWTSNLAYAIGLLVTDGNLSKDGRHINLRSSDKSLLKTFKSCLEIQNKIARTWNDEHAKKPIYRVQFGNVQFYRWLISIGITPAKTYTIGPIKIPKEFFRDFLRGHLDGDGSIYHYKDNYNIYKNKRYINTRIYTKFISVSEKHIRWLHKMIKKYVKVHGALLRKTNKGNRVDMWEIKIAKYESLKLFRWLYYKDNLPTLQRKRRIADGLLNRVTHSKLVR